MGDAAQEGRITKVGKLIITGGTQWDKIGRKGKVEDAERPDLPGPHVYRSVAEIKFRHAITGPASCHHVLIDENSLAYVFGRNEHGQLGTGNTVNVNDPTPIMSFADSAKALKGQLIKGAATGRGHTLLLTETGTVYAAGENRLGQCGHENLKGLSVFKLVGGIKEKIEDVKCGAEFSVALTETGKVYTWGSPQYGQLGNGRDGKYFAGSREAFNEETEPTLADKTIKQIACGANHTLALDSDGYVHAWGFGGYGRLGMNEPQDQMVPKPIPHFLGTNVTTRATSIAAGSACSIFLDGQHSLWLCGKWKTTGDGSSGQPWMYPKTLYDLQGWKFREIKGGGVTLFAVSESDSTTICWGQGALHGELGYGEGKPKSQTKPARCDPLVGIEIEEVSCGVGTTVFIASGPNDKVADLAKFPELEQVPPEICVICNKEENDEQILLCDKCDEPSHMYCADPPLAEIPAGEWFCQVCKAGSVANAASGKASTTAKSSSGNKRKKGAADGASASVSVKRAR